MPKCVVFHQFWRWYYVVLDELVQSHSIQLPIAILDIVVDLQTGNI